jgi:hypothetical protein
MHNARLINLLVFVLLLALMGGCAQKKNYAQARPHKRDLISGVRVYTVKKGDTVWDICRKKFDIPLWLLKKYNSKLDFRSLRSSQLLTIPIVKTI